MRDKYTAPCTRDCPRRAIDCHGKHDDGTWKCKEWGDFQATEAERKEKLKKSVFSNRMMAEYEKSRRAKKLHKESRKAK